MPAFRLPDPYAGKSLKEMKEHARKLVMSLSRWQHIAMKLSDGGGIESLPAEWQEELRRYLAAYAD